MLSENAMARISATTSAVARCTRFQFGVFVARLLLLQDLQILNERLRYGDAQRCEGYSAHPLRAYAECFIPEADCVRC